MKLPSGVYTALVTPFFEDGSLNLPLLTTHVERQIEDGVAALVALGSTGEALTLSDRERAQVVETVVRAAKKRVPVIVGTGASSTRQTIEYSKGAKELGASGLLVVTPPYLRPTQEGIYQHYKALSESVDLPILLYNIPSRAAQEVEISTVERLSKLPNIKGIKDSSKSLSYALELGPLLRDDFILLAGDCLYTYPMISIGARGVISGSANLIPRQMCELTRASLEKDPVALEMTRSLLPLLKALSLETNPIPLKGALNIAGIPVGPPRLPLTPLSQKHIETLKGALKEHQRLSNLVQS